MGSGRRFRYRWPSCSLTLLEIRTMTKHIAVPHCLQGECLSCGKPLTGAQKQRGRKFCSGPCRSKYLAQEGFMTGRKRKPIEERVVNLTLSLKPILARLVGSFGGRGGIADREAVRSGT